VLFDIIEIGYNMDNLMFIRVRNGLLIVVFFINGSSACIPSRDGRLDRLRVHI
jgi:hypothetical protein